MSSQESISKVVRDDLKIPENQRFFDNSDKLLNESIVISKPTTNTILTILPGSINSTSFDRYSMMDIHSSAIYSDLRYTYSRIKRLDRLAYALYAELIVEKLTSDDTLGVINDDHIKRLEYLLVHISEAMDDAKKVKGVTDYSRRQPTFIQNDHNASESESSSVYGRENSKVFSFEKFRDVDERISRHKISSGINSSTSSNNIEGCVK